MRRTTSFSPTRLVIIPARGGSIGVKRKCSRRVGDVPLLVRSIQTAAHAASVDRIIVSTDDAEYAELAVANGGEVPFLRPPELATSTSSIVDTIAHLCQAIEQAEGELPAFLCLLQPTSPFTQPEDLDDAFALFDADTDAVTSVCESPAHPHWLRYCDDEGWMSPLRNLTVPPHTSRQAVQRVFCLNGAVYWVRTAAFLRYNCFLPERSRAFEMPVERSLDIDSEFDLKVAALLAEEEKHEVHAHHRRARGQSQWGPRVGQKHAARRPRRRRRRGQVPHLYGRACDDRANALGLVHEARARA